MKSCPHEIIAIPHNAALDLIVAIRCLVLHFPAAKILHPVHLRQNAWETVRKLPWFKTIKFNETDFSELKTVHLPGFTHTRQNHELTEELSRLNCEINVYSDQEVMLPFPFRQTKSESLSLTAFLLNRLRATITNFHADDIYLFTLAVTEKTWAGLSSRIKESDNLALSFLRSFTALPEDLATLLFSGCVRDRQGFIARCSKISKICSMDTGRFH